MRYLETMFNQSMMANLVLFEGLCVLVFLFSTSSTLSFEPVDLKVNFDSQSSPDFKVLLSGVEWLRSSVVSVRDNGQTWASNNNGKNLLKPMKQYTESGEDSLGEFDTTM